MSDAEYLIENIEQAFGGKFNKPIPEEIMAKARGALCEALRDKGCGIAIQMSMHTTSKAAFECAIARALLVEREEAYARGRADGLEEAARVGYATCAETRHVRLGQQVSNAIRAMK